MSVHHNAILHMALNEKSRIQVRFEIHKRHPIVRTQYGVVILRSVEEWAAGYRECRVSDAAHMKEGESCHTCSHNFRRFSRSRLSAGGSGHMVYMQYIIRTMQTVCVW